MEIVAPLSGTQLWADVWSVPSRTRGVQGAFMAAPSGGAFSTGGPGSSGISPLLPSWLEFCLAKGRLIGERMGTHLPAPSLCVVYIDAKRTDQYNERIYTLQLANWAKRGCLHHACAFMCALCCVPQSTVAARLLSTPACGCSLLHAVCRLHRPQGRCTSTAAARGCATGHTSARGTTLQTQVSIHT